MMVTLGTASGVVAKEHRILVLPGGGGTGVAPATYLAAIEEQTGKSVSELFDEIWGTSIGAVMAALYSDPMSEVEIPRVESELQADYQTAQGRKTRTAQQVLEFIQTTFSHYHKAFQIRGALRKTIGTERKLNQTVIPVRILAAEVTQWYAGMWPSQTQFIGFNPQTYGNCSLTEVACSSCTVFPIHPKAEQVNCSGGQIKYCIDAGTEVCTQQSMNPLWYFIEEFNSQLPSGDTVSIYFMSNGWVRLPQWLQAGGVQSISNQAGTKSFPVMLYNLDMQLDPVFQDWKSDRKMGRLVQGFCQNDSVLCNMAGVGMIPMELLKKEADRIVQESEVFQQMINSFQTLQ